MLPNSIRTARLSRLTALNGSSASARVRDGIPLAQPLPRLISEARLGYSTDASHLSRTSDDQIDPHSASVDDKLIDRSDPETIFPASRASSRPHPHAFPLFGKMGSGAAAKPNRTPRSAVSGSGGRSTPVRRTLNALQNLTGDPLLKDLYTRLASAADRADVIAALEICRSIKGHVESQPSTSSSSSSSASPPGGPLLPQEQQRGVYQLLIRCFGQQGLLEETKGVVEDMRRSGVEADSATLNWILKAAVMRGDSQAIDEVLDQIQRLPRELDRTEAPQPEPKRSPASTMAAASELFFSGDRKKGCVASPAELLPLVDEEYSRNWTSATYHQLMLSAHYSHSVESGLALLASSIRNGVALEHESLRVLVLLCLNAKEHRLAAEIANQLELGGFARMSADASPGHAPTSIARRLAPSLWMAILRGCAEGGYLPGLELAWQKAVVEGLLVPDEGLLLQALNVASNHGSVPFCIVILERLYPGFAKLLEGDRPGVRRPGRSDPDDPFSKGIVLQEWHLAPLFEAQCLNFEYEPAIRTLSLMKRCGHPVTSNTSVGLARACYGSLDRMKEAFDGLVRAGQDSRCGVDISAVNALLSAAVWSHQMPLAMEIYQQSRQLLDVVQRAPDDATPAAAQAPSKPRSRRPPRRGQGAAPPAEEPSAAKVQPNLETYHVLFSGCIDRADRDLGGSLIADLNALALNPTVLTYERMILLCLTQESYEDAFGFMEQAKVNGLVPSRKSYEGVIRKCHGVDDERWQWVLDEMKEAGYYPSRRLASELGIVESLRER